MRKKALPDLLPGTRALSSKEVGSLIMRPAPGR